MPTRKISYDSMEDLSEKIKDIPGKIIEINECLPDRTDTKYWVEVLYQEEAVEVRQCNVSKD